MQNKTEAINFLEDQLNEIYSIDCNFVSLHGVNMEFTLNTNELDLSKFHPDELFFYDKEGKWIMDYFKNTNKFWLSRNNIWEKLEKEFGLNYTEIKDLIKDMLERQFKCKVDITDDSFIVKCFY